LILGRKVGEKVVVGEGVLTVTVVVVSVDHGQVRLGFDGPRSVPVHRSELIPYRSPVKESEVQVAEGSQAEPAPPAVDLPADRAG
jgi:carbon storage regulator